MLEGVGSEGRNREVRTEDMRADMFGVRKEDQPSFLPSFFSLLLPSFPPLPSLPITLPPCYYCLFLPNAHVEMLTPKNDGIQR